MDITLSTVRSVLRKALGFESFTARFIERVTPDASCGTAAISRDGALSYDPAFIEKYIKTPEDLFSLIFHETLHHVFGHFIYSTGPIENIAADAVINATISQIYSDHSANGDLFQRLYPATGLPGMLRPKSNLRNSSLQQVYEALYRSHRHFPDNKMSTGELIRTLRIILPKSTAVSFTLLGSHGTGHASALPSETAASIAADIKHSLRNQGRQGDYSQALESLLIEVLDSRLSLSRKLLEKYTTKRKLDRFKEQGQEHQRSTSPIPLFPSKRDMVLLAAGCWPGYFHNRHQRPAAKQTGLAIYLDVSGSVKEHLPDILGAIAKLGGEVTTIYLFSNQVVETTLKDLVRGNIKTTWGTDFNCIARSIIEKNLDRAVVITDGYANLNTELAEELKSQRVSVLTILFGVRRDCPEFQPFGDIVQLEEVQ